MSRANGECSPGKGLGGKKVSTQSAANAGILSSDGNRIEAHVRIGAEDVQKEIPGEFQVEDYQPL
jgi:hypothetical protein